MHVAKVMWACARDESGLTEFVVVAHTIRFISDDTMQPALDSLGGTPDSSILMQVGTSSPWGKGMKRSTLGSKVKVTLGRNR